MRGGGIVVRELRSVVISSKLQQKTLKFDSLPFSSFMNIVRNAPSRKVDDRVDQKSCKLSCLRTHSLSNQPLKKKERKDRGDISLSLRH